MWKELNVARTHPTSGQVTGFIESSPLTAIWKEITIARHHNSLSQVTGLIKPSHLSTINQRLEIYVERTHFGKKAFLFEPN